MPAPTIVSDFLECVRKSTVVEPKSLDDYLARVGGDAPDSPAKMADALVAEGLITRFQADQMLRGRWRNFILSGKYIILEPLGAGGMGTVYLCSHRIMRRPVAVKVLPAGQAEDAGAVERFQREAQAVAQLRHPNIVGAHDIDRDGKFHFLVMEYIDGVSLQELVKRRGPLAPERAAHYMHQAALGLQHAHEAGLVHRDIKPANLVVDRAGVVKILDLGLARFFHDKKESLTQKYDGNAVLGTADYLSPEQAVDSHNVDIRCDIYSLGVTFYFLLAGHSPFQDGSVAEKLIWHQVRQPKPIRETRPEVPEGLAEVLEKMLAKEPARRYQTPAELAEALAPYTQTAIDPPSDSEIPKVSPAARIAGFSEVNYSTPRLPAPNTPTPAAIKPASTGPRRPQPSNGPDDTNGRKNAKTAMITSSPATVISPAAAPSSHREARPLPDLLRRTPWLVWAGGAAVLGALLLGVIALIIAMNIGHAPPSAPPVAGVPAPPNPVTLLPEPPPIGAVEGVSIQKEDDGLHIRTTKYEALIEPSGCLDSLRIGGVEFLRAGELLNNGKSVARGAYFYSDKEGHQGAVKMPDVRQTVPNVVTARGDKFDVTYEFNPDEVTLLARNSTDFTAPYYIVLDSASVTDVAAANGERLAVPVAKNIGDPVDPKWDHTTWIAGRSRLDVTCQDAEGVKIWGPFGAAKSQIWHTNIGTYQTAKIHLRPSVAAQEEKRTAPPGGVLLTRQGATRRAQTDAYEAVVEGDGCLTHLRVDGVEFFKPGVGISRGSYFHQQDTLKLPDVTQSEAAVITAQGEKAAIRYEFGPEKMTWALENKTNAGMAFYVVFDTAVQAVKNGKDEWAKIPATAQPDALDPKWGATTWYAGRAWVKFTGGSRVWGPWEQKYQVWEASLAPHEKRTVTVEVGLTTKEEAEKAAATAGVKPILPSDLAMFAPLDYQVFQRKTRLQGSLMVHGRMRSAFDALEYRLTGKPLEGAALEEWRPLPSSAGAKTFDADLSAPAGGWYKLEVRAMKDGKEIAHAAVDHVGVGEVFVGAGQSNSTSCGQERIQPTTGMVSTFSGIDWRLADDPQPGAHDDGLPGCTGGSYWPAFGDAMYEKYRVPIGVAVTGHSGTSVNQWQPGGELFLWTVGRMNQLGREGFRAVLWHQGESDTGMPAEEYVRKMTALIEQSRKAAGWDVPWLVAQVSYHNPNDTMTAATREAQKKLWDTGVALEGPDTDKLIGDDRDNNGKGIHFSAKGLRAHGRMWAEKVGVWLDKELK
jgi:eukaryotic-like serine/threonine-protein kinase